jgi:hypothetical protein
MSRTQRRVWLASAVATLLLHAVAFLGGRLLGPFDAARAQAREPAPIEVVFSDPVSPEGEEPRVFSELPPELEDEPPERADLLSNVDSRARDLEPGGEDGLPRLEGLSEAPHVRMDPGDPEPLTPVEDETPPAEEPEPAEAGDSPAPPEDASSPREAALSRIPSLYRSPGTSDRFQEAMSNPEGNVTISDGISLNTVAWDYAPWIQRFLRVVEERWRAPVGYHLGLIYGWTLVRLEIAQGGELLDLRVVGSEGHEALSNASVHALRSPAPYHPLPADFPEEKLVLQIKMMYPKLER